MEELGKLKARIEGERALILRATRTTHRRLLQEEAEKMKQVTEEAARLGVAAQERHGCGSWRRTWLSSGPGREDAQGEDAGSTGGHAAQG